MNEQPLNVRAGATDCANLRCVVHFAIWRRCDVFRSYCQSLYDHTRQQKASWRFLLLIRNLRSDSQISRYLNLFPHQVASSFLPQSQPQLRISITSTTTAIIAVRLSYLFQSAPQQAKCDRLRKFASQNLRLVAKSKAHTTRLSAKTSIVCNKRHCYLVLCTLIIYSLSSISNLPNGTCYWLDQHQPHYSDTHKWQLYTERESPKSTPPSI